MHRKLREKKLQEAACYWLTSGKATSTESLEDDLEAWGMSPQDIEKFSKKDTSKDDFFGLWPCNIDAWEAFIIICGQWNTNAMGRATGLNYASVKAGLSMAEIETSKTLFAKLRTIENAIINRINENNG